MTGWFITLAIVAVLGVYVWKRQRRRAVPPSPSGEDPPPDRGDLR